MEIYIYCADIYCKKCGKSLIDNEVKDLNKTNTGDSNDYPQGPTEAGEADYPQHCGDCGVFLENPLTSDGEDYVRECIADKPNNVAMQEWIAYYDYL